MGSYALETNENFSNYLYAQGVRMVKRNLVNSANMTFTFSFDNASNTLTIDVVSTYKTDKKTLIIGGDEEKVEYAAVAGLQLFVKAVSSDTGFAIKRRAENGVFTEDVDFVFSDDGFVQNMTMTAKDGTITNAK